MNLQDLRIPIGKWVDSGVDWLRDNLEWLFDGIADVLDLLIDSLEAVLQWPGALGAIIIFALIAWRARTWRFGLFSLAGFTLIATMDQWEAAMSTLALVLVASIIAVLIGMPLGILAARKQSFSTFVRPALDLMQTMPSFVYLIPAIIFFGIGKVPGVVATIVFAMPPAVRLTELGLRQVDPEVVEAGEAFGASPARILTRIQVPLALPTIMAGVNQVIMLSLSMVVIAGIVGAGGLGAEVFRGVTRLDVGLGFEGGLSVVIVAIFLDRVTGALGEKASKRTSR